MLKWTVPRRAEPAEELSSILPTNPTPRRYSSRQSFGGSQSQRSRDQRRQSLVTTAMNNKENDILASQQSIMSIRNPTATSTPFAHHQKALRDVGNTTPTTVESPNPIAAIRKRHLPPSPTVPSPPKAKKQYATTIPTFGVEYSPMNATRSGPAIALRGLTVPDSFFGSARYFQDGALPAKRLKSSDKVVGVPHLIQRTDIFNNNEEEDAMNMSSKALNDDELNQMIDDILKSKRKAVPIMSTRRSSNLLKCPPPQKRLHPEVTTTKDINEKLERFMKSHNSHPVPPSLPSLLPEERTKPIHDYIHDHPFLRQSIDFLASLNTPPKDNRSSPAIDNGCNLKQRGSPVVHDAISPSLASKAIRNEDFSTPSSEAQTTIRRCLQFSESPESLDDWLEKRKSMASTVSTTSSRCSMRSTGTIATGTLDLTIAANGDRVDVHVIRCKELWRPNAGPINAYVKLTILPTIPTSSSANNGYQRTSVHRNSTKPHFDHRFVFEGVEPNPAPGVQRIQLTVWHRDRELKRSEFLGCLSFPLANFNNPQTISGSFRLQPQSCLTNPHPAIPEPNHTTNSTPQLTEATLRQRNREESLFHQDPPNQHDPLLKYSIAPQIASNCQRVLPNTNTEMWHTNLSDERKSMHSGAAFTYLDRRKSDRQRSMDPAYNNSLCAH